MYSCFSPLLKAISAYLQKADDNLEDELVSSGFAKASDTIDTIKALEGDVVEALVEETELFTTAVRGAVDLQTFGKDIWPGVKLNDKLAKKLTGIFKDRLTEIMPGLVETYLQRTDKQLTLQQVSKLTTGWIEQWSEQLAEIMQLNSHTEIEKILETGLANGDSIAVFTQNILDSGIRDEYYKARRVSVTEVLTAHRAAQQEAFMQSPAVVEKAWKHTGEYRNEPRQNHVDMDGKRVPKEEPFELKGGAGDDQTYTPMYPGATDLPAKERINCHCICQPVVSEEILGLPLEERQRLQQEAIDSMDDEWERELDAQNRARAGIE